MFEEHLNILIIDKTSADIDGIVHHLQEAKFEFDYLLVDEDLKQVQSILQQVEVDAIILETERPRIREEDTLRMIRDADPTIPFILLTGSRNQKIETSFLKLGVDEVILKPNINRLPFALKRVLFEYKNKKRLKLMESVVTHANDAVMILETRNEDGPGRKIAYVNDALTRMTGYDKEEILGKTTNFLNGPKTDKKKLKELGEAMDRQQPYKVDLINYRKNGEEFWVNILVKPVKDQKGDLRHWICIERDITDRIVRERKIQSSLREKEALLAEVHHRVKNNLAVVSGFLQLEQLVSSSQETKDILRKAELRVKSIATIHENLYKANNFAEISSEEYLDDIIDSVRDAYEMGEKEITVEKQISDFHLNVNQAIPFGLIVNELLSNIYKHAFNDQDEGKVRIEVSEKNSQVILSVEDNGKGLPGHENNAYEDNANLGFTIIKTLVRQLDGTVEAFNGTGFTYRLQFMRHDSKGSANSYFKAPPGELEQ